MTLFFNHFLIFLATMSVLDRTAWHQEKKGLDATRTFAATVAKLSYKLALLFLDVNDEISVLRGTGQWIQGI